MSIDTTGKWWIGTEAMDIKEYLEAYSAENYPITQFKLAKCICGSEVFRLIADSTESVAQRICTICNSEHFICDSEEYWEEAEPEEFICVECDSKHANIGVGFSFYHTGDIRWIYIGERCADCGVLGSMADWKIGYAPSEHLLEQV